MFTGIIEELGTVRECAGARLTVECEIMLSDLVVGGSVAVNGVCLTASGVQRDAFSADLAPETLARSNLGDLTIGSRVNLERPVAVGARLSGHFVQGHVDATGELVWLESLGDENWWLRVRVPAAVERYLVYKGSIALDGVSLTIASLEDDVVAVTIIPHTWRNTTLGLRRPGDRLNIECDMLAKHVEKLLGRLHLP